MNFILKLIREIQLTNTIVYLKKKLRMFTSKKLQYIGC